MSTEPNRPLSGVSLPQWMKSKISDRYDLDSNAFSPPSHDDGFLILRYSKSRSRSPDRKEQIATPEFKPIGEALSEARVSTDRSVIRHTESCQDFIPQAKFTPREIGLRHVSSEIMDKVKSTGTDDGFKGEPAACAYSVLAVAQTMVSGGASGKGLLDVPLPASHRVRRNSKSLPASPLSSPKILRRNPFFTDPLFGSSEIGKMGLDMPHHIEDKEIPVVRARPSQLREMNFLSPTSM